MKIIIIGDDAIVELSLKTILEATGEIKVLGTGRNGQDAINLYEIHQPDVALIDIQMPLMSGIDAAKEILELDRQEKILFLTTFSDNEYIIKALNIGVKGYLLKQDFESIAPALKAVKAGQTVFGTDIVSKLSNLVHENKLFLYGDYGINEKEEKIIHLVAQGLSNKEISNNSF